MSNFRVRLFAGFDAEINDDDQELIVVCSDNDWEDYCVVHIPGFDTYASADIAEVWAEFHRNGGQKTIGQTIGYETIFKRGETQQLKSTFTVVIDKVS